MDFSHPGCKQIDRCDRFALANATQQEEGIGVGDRRQTLQQV